MVVESSIDAIAPLHGRPLRVPTGPLHSMDRNYRNTSEKPRIFRADIPHSCFYHVVFASWILTSGDVYVLHAELLAVVGVGCAREGQQQHIDKSNIGLTCSGGNSRLVVVPNLIRADKRKETDVLEVSMMNWKGLVNSFGGGGTQDKNQL